MPRVLSELMIECKRYLDGPDRAVYTATIMARENPKDEQDRRRRLEEALRANLHRRKQQKRARARQDPSDDVSEADDAQD
ncbi:MAG: hypothetical protein AAF501_15320 [Pseudomonadota bacterium]